LLGLYLFICFFFSSNFFFNEELLIGNVLLFLFFLIINFYFFPSLYFYTECVLKREKGVDFFNFFKLIGYSWDLNDSENLGSSLESKEPEEDPVLPLLSEPEDIEVPLDIEIPLEKKKVREEEFYLSKFKDEEMLGGLSVEKESLAVEEEEEDQKPSLKEGVWFDKTMEDFYSGKNKYRENE